MDHGSFATGTNEKHLSSGDRLDAHFDNGKQRLAVEVKTSGCSEDELQRGVYQAVKYRAILRAEQKAQHHDNHHVDDEPLRQSESDEHVSPFSFRWTVSDARMANVIRLGYTRTSNLQGDHVD